MKLFNLFQTKNQKSEDIVVNTPVESAVLENEPEQTKNDHVYYVDYATHMPIDRIYAELRRNRDEEGYKDAMVTNDASYCQQKESMIISQLQNLISQVKLAYESQIIELAVSYKNAEALFASQQCEMIEAKKQICIKHQDEISSIEQKIADRHPQVMIMVDSYHRGFVRGLSAQAINN